MSTAPAPTLGSYDDRGLSVVTSTMTAADPRQGTLYDSKSLAAGVPVYYHPLQSGTYLALFASRWGDATVGTAGPQSYSAYTDSGVPCAVEVDVVSGRDSPVFDLPVASTVPRTLTGACGRKNSFWTVGQDEDGNGVIGVYRVTERHQGVAFDKEEVVPPVDGVTFSNGCTTDGDDLVVFGTDTSGQVYAARKAWFRIGYPNAADGAWSYYTPQGWGVVSAMAPLGAGFTSTGPVSAAQRWGKWWVSTVTTTSGSRTARVWTGRTLSSLKPSTVAPVSLGNDATYLQGGLYFQPQINASPVMSAASQAPGVAITVASKTAMLALAGVHPGDVAVIPGTADAGSYLLSDVDSSVEASWVKMPAIPSIPYITSVKVVSGANQSISNGWGLHSVM